MGRKHVFSSKKRSGTGALIGLTLALSGLGAVWLWHIPGEEPKAVEATATTVEQAKPAPKPKVAVPQPQPEPTPLETAQAQTPAELPSTPKVWEAEAFSPSLEGTEIDGQLRADADGNLIVELEVKDFFDYFLNTVGEVSPEQAIAQIQNMANDHLPSPAAAQAEELLEGYLAYKQRSFDYAQQPLVPPGEQTPAYQLQQLREAQAALKRIRRETLSTDAADAFFGMEEAYGNFTLASIEIQQRDDLSAQQKREMINYERSRLPEVVRKSHERVTRSAHQADTVEDIIRTATSPQEARSKLESMGLSEAHLKEIVTVLESQESFESHYLDYREERNALQEAGLADETRERAESDLRDRYFDSEQQKTWARLRDLDDSPGPASGES